MKERKREFQNQKTRSLALLNFGNQAERSGEIAACEVATLELSWYLHHFSSALMSKKLEQFYLLTLLSLKELLENNPIVYGMVKKT